MTVTDIGSKRVEQQIDDRLDYFNRLRTNHRHYADLAQHAALTTFDTDPADVAAALSLKLGHDVPAPLLVELADALSEYDRGRDHAEVRFWFDRAESLTCGILAGPSIPCAVDLFEVGA